MERWEQSAFKDEEGDWEALGDNGWFAMMAWAAGPDNVRKSVQSDTARTVRFTGTKGGLETARLEPFTPQDRRVVDESVNDYLREAGIPPRPSGVVWHLRVPADWSGNGSVADELSSRIRREQRDGQSPGELRPHVERIVADFYAKNGY